MVQKSILYYLIITVPERESEKFMITSRVDELTNEIIELKKTIGFLKEKLEYHKLG